MNRGVAWLKAQDLAEVHADDGALVALCLGELYATSRDFTLRRPAQRALDAVLAARTPDGGGSRDGDAPGASAHRTAWSLLALRAGRAAHLAVEDEAVEPRARPRRT